jgi:2'-5' RNA ligase
VRLFVAVELSDEMRQAASATIDDLQHRLGRRLVARWLPPDNLHITVRFIGEVSETTAPDLLRALTAPISLPPFEVRFGACGAFPHGGPPRVIWIGLANGVPSFATINGEMNRRLERFGFEAEQRQYSAHLTIARVKELARGSASDVRRILRETPIPDGHCRVDHATIFRSRLSPKGARYESLATSAFLYP